jgi:hypothetical protein
MVICPYCRQDYVWEIGIHGLTGPLYMCLECDTVWEAPGDVSDSTGQNFEEFMVQRGRDADWKAISKIRRVGEA